MKRVSFLLSIISSLVLATTSVEAQTSEPTSVRVDTGAALDFNEPQDTRFGPGGAGALKLTFDLTPWFDVAPSVMTEQFAPNRQYSATGVSGLWAFGAGARLKRSHSAPDNTIWAATSPWIDADAQYIRTGNLNRFGYSVGAGLSAPMDSARHFWLGPYLRWTEVVDGTQWGGNSGLNHTDASILSFGLELEFNFTGKKAVVASTPTVNPLPIASVPKVEEKRIKVQEVPFVIHREGTLDYRVQFDFDSAVLHDDAKSQLDKLSAYLNDTSTHPNTTVDSIEVDGHASSENHPWAEKHNQLLSVQRAAAVVEYLVSNGVTRALLTAKGFGTTASTGLNKVEDRRVEFILSVTVTGKVVVRQ